MLAMRATLVAWSTLRERPSSVTPPGQRFLRNCKLLYFVTPFWGYFVELETDQCAGLRIQVDPQHVGIETALSPQALPESPSEWRAFYAYKTAVFKRRSLKRASRVVSCV